MKFKDYIKESIIDIPRRRYAPGVFDDADTNNPKLKKVVVNMILDLSPFGTHTFSFSSNL